MRVVFMGSAHLACPAVEALLGSKVHELAAVVTQPDRPRGRNLRTGACPVKELAVARGIPALAPERIADAAAVEALLSFAPDLIAVAAYGQFIPRAVRELPPRGIVNIHPSLLPKYRGAAPIPWAIANGDRVTGVSIIDVSARMDAGDILLQESCPILDEDSTATLEPRLAAMGAAMLMRAIDLLGEGRAERRPQDEALATHARKLEKADGRIDWSLDATTLHRRIRAFHPWPGCCCEAAGRSLKIIRARVESIEGSPPGVMIESSDEGPAIACGRDALRLLDVQPEGRNVMSGAAYVRGARPVPGTVFA
jgi:methionyl-tRNA formyltransferase